MALKNVNISPEEIGEQKKIAENIKRSFNGEKRLALVETFGCQQNVNDSQRLEGMLLSMGYSLTDKREDADLIIFNTCAVRENAESRVYGNLGELKRLKQKKPSLIIGVCGCMVQQESIANTIKAKFRHVDMVFGTYVLYKFPSILSEVLEHREKIFDISGEGNIAEGIPVRYEGGARAFVSIMYGCNNFCSYCIVPYVRGRERSRTPQAVINECESLVKMGVREIMLLGQNVNSYGKEFGKENAFASLLEDVCKIEGLERVRFMSSHPKDITDTLLETMAREKKICKQLHLPLQSGSDRVLKEMNRHYDMEKFMHTVNKARELMSDITLTTDIIVGFPTETEEDFLLTVEALRKARFDSIFSFIYSPREGTEAAKIENVASKEEIDKRFSHLLDVQNEISFERNHRHEGEIERVLVSGVSKNDKTVLSGRNEGNKVVNFKGPESLIGTFCDVKITKAQTWVLYGELV